MGVFRRMADIVTANFNGVLDRVENPERMLAQIIREMEEGVAVARQQVAVCVSAERRVLRELEATRTAANTWNARARLALDSRREDLARLALARHFEQLDLARLLKDQYRMARQASGNARAALNVLEDRLAQARRQHRLLQTRQQTAHVQAQALASTHAGGNSPFARFTRLENRLAEMQDDLLVHAEIISPSQSLEAQLATLEADQRVARALTAMKREKEETK